MTDPAAPESAIAVERIFRVGGQDQAVRLDAVVWAAFDEFCERQEFSGEELCARAALRLGDDSLEDKIAGFLTAYFKEAAECDLPTPTGFAEDDGAAPTMSPALRAALDAVGR